MDDLKTEVADLGPQNAELVRLRRRVEDARAEGRTLARIADQVLAEEQSRRAEKH